MEYFPEESVAKAREIAELYSIRKKSKLGKAILLFEGKFIELNYGFEDAIKSGRCGVFLHEAKLDAECFSLLGIDYLVAREAGLNPKMYWASGQRNVNPGKRLSETDTGEHGFLVVDVGKRKKPFIVDRSYSLIGPIDMKDNKIVVTNQPANTNEKDDERYYGKKQTERYFECLTQLSDEDYVKKMYECRTPEGGKTTLTSGQSVYNLGKRIFLQYLPESHELLASATYGVSQPIIEENPAKNHHYELKITLSDDGAWILDQSTLSLFKTRSFGWMKEDHGLIHSVIAMPYQLVEKYIEHLTATTKFFGRKTPPSHLSTNDIVGYFQNRGYSVLGEITKENGVNPREHSALLEEIVSRFPTEEPEEVRASIDQAAKYTALQVQNISEDNPQGLIYPESVRNEFVMEFIEKFHDMVIQKGELVYQVWVAEAKIDGNLKKSQRKMAEDRYGHNELSRFQGQLSNKSKFPHDFDQEIDYAIFQRDNPRNTVEATDEERRLYYQVETHTRLLYGLFVLPRLQLKTYRRGLQKILAQT